MPTKVEIDLRKSIPENAAHYYEMAKKAKRKIPRLIEEIERTKRLIEEQEKELEKKPKKRREKDWYEKFHWFFTSDGFLVLGGKDARSNQKLVRNYLEDRDLFFHADIKGASAVILKSGGKTISDEAKKEAARFASAFSKAFSLGLRAVDVYCVKPDQVKLAAKSGEFLPKGGFVILGEREWFKDVPVEIAVSYDKEKQRIVSGPAEAMKRYGNYILVVPGEKDKGDVAKAIKNKIDEWFSVDSSIDEILAALPAGKARLILPQQS